MLYTETMARDNIRNADGKRVFYLGKGDMLTSGAKDFLSRERIEIRPAEMAKPAEYRLLSGAVLREKPEQMTHLNGNILVPKTHPRIRFRGEMDALEAELMLCQLNCEEWRAELGEILALARKLIRCEVMGEPVEAQKLCGLTEGEQRSRSHRPQDYYKKGKEEEVITFYVTDDKNHLPVRLDLYLNFGDGPVILGLNRCRVAARRAELAAAAAFTDGDGNCSRVDILRALNRMSSMLYILMIRQKGGKQGEIL